MLLALLAEFEDKRKCMVILGIAMCAFNCSLHSKIGIRTYRNGFSLNSMQACYIFFQLVAKHECDIITTKSFPKGSFTGSFCAGAGTPDAWTVAWTGAVATTTNTFFNQVNTSLRHASSTATATSPRPVWSS